VLSDPCHSTVHPNRNKKSNLSTPLSVNVIFIALTKKTTAGLPIKAMAVDSFRLLPQSRFQHSTDFYIEVILVPSNYHRRPNAKDELFTVFKIP
jgi:hypothetical protein